MSNTIKVLRTNLNNSGKGNAVSFHSASVNGVIINDLALLPSTRPNQDFFVALPSRPFENKQGKQQYARTVVIESTVDADALEKACIEAYEAAKVAAEKK